MHGEAYRLISQAAASAATAGAGRGRQLTPGRYRLRAVPRFAGQNGIAVTRPFRILRR